jgi:penicillin-binding protein 1A
VVDGRGQVRADFLTARKTRVVSAECIEQSRTVLREVVRAGTGRAAAPRQGEAFGKTGTSSGNADAWFVGWSGGQVLGTWMGRERGANGPVLTGAGAPATFFRRVAEAARADELRRKAAAAARIATPTPRMRAAAKMTAWIDTLTRAVTSLLQEPARNPAESRIPLPPLRPRLEAPAGRSARLPPPAPPGKRWPMRSTTGAGEGSPG